MEFSDFLELIKKKSGTIFTLVFITVILTIALSLLNPLKYGATSGVLVVQNTAGSDPYTVSKSNEYLGNLFSRIVYSASFYDFVLNSPYNIDKNYFTGTYNQQLENWEKTVKTKTFGDTGIIEINVYHQNPYQAQQISLAINEVLINNNAYYQGSGQAIKVNVIDQPLVSTYPVKPNLPRNIALGFIGGLFLSLVYIYIFPEERHDLKLWTAKKKRKVKALGKAVKIEDYQSEESPTEETGIEETPSEKNEVEDMPTEQSEAEEIKETEKPDEERRLEPEEYSWKENRDQTTNSPRTEERPSGDMDNILKF
jgi:capsular polysaccharide biosynthesis protein